VKLLLSTLVAAVFTSTGLAAQALAHAPLHVRVDASGPYLILVTAKAHRHYSEAIAVARQLHPAAVEQTFNPDDLPEAKKVLLARQPHYILLFMKPEELDVNFAWQWLTLCTQLNDDPLVAARTGSSQARRPRTRPLS